MYNEIAMIFVVLCLASAFIEYLPPVKYMYYTTTEPLMEEQLQRFSKSVHFCR